MNKGYFLCIAFFFVLEMASAQDKTSFQIAAPWDARYDVRSDIVMVYGINDAGGNFEERVKGWLHKGYNVQFMTGIAWGQYQDYFLGDWDGKKHFDDAQVQRNGDTIWHGKNVPYIVPSKTFLTYIKTHIKRAIDAGVSAIYLEEPEFWARAGYSASFQLEWKKFYGSEYIPQHVSPNATYMSSKLKYHLYLEALKETFAYTKAYARSVNRDVKCFVPTHSLINYSAWQIVSPEASLASIKELDGYIAQVWTGTSREPIFFSGVKKERVFENAFIEYGSMVSMTAPTGKRIYFLTDPIEDWPRSWNDYKRNYEATYTAQLLYPTVSHYEVMPWPQRIYLGKFKVEGSDKKQPISAAYATQMQIMVNALNRMPASNNRVSGSQGIGVLVSNSMMFQRFPTHDGYEDPQLSNFYGMVMPLIKKGVPVELVHMENLENDNALKNVKVLIMSYANMKPLSEGYHKRLADWVHSGGILMYYGKDDDPFQTVTEWWNTNGKNFQSPSEDLFDKLKVDRNVTGKFLSAGKGRVFIERTDPKELVMRRKGDVNYLGAVKDAYQRRSSGALLEEKNNFLLQRGPYLIAAVMDEFENGKPLKIPGSFIDLFDPDLPILTEKVVLPGTQAFLFDLAKIERDRAKVLAAAARVYDEQRTKRRYSFTVKSPSETMNSMRIFLPSEPTVISADKENEKILIRKQEWDQKTRTLLLQFENESEGVRVAISY